MMRLVVSSLLAALWVQPSEGCTTLAVGKKASADGSVLLSHSDDGEAFQDPRVCYIPARDHPEGTMRPVYWDTEDYPRFVGYQRGSCYHPTGSEQPYEPIGYIPQVPHTYAYYEATYGLMNEHGLGIAESTCSGIYGTNAVGHGGQALLSIDEMSRIALERATKAKEAIQLIGRLAEKHGFYGAGSFEGSAESLYIGDKEEVWVFHILPDENGTSAIWAAQRIPDDHVSVVANMFIIREINFTDSDNFLWSESVQTTAQRKGWWSPGQKLDFTAVYSDGEYAHKFYSGRRMWGAYLKWGKNFSPDYDVLRYDKVYPVSATPAHAVVPKDLFSIHRFFYQGTPYDMTQGLAAGAFGNPDRFAVAGTAKGNWERSIGLYRTTSTHVVKTGGSSQSVLWFSPHATTTAVMVPLTLDNGTNVLAKPYTIGNPHEFSRESAYWANRNLASIVRMRYNLAIQDVQALQGANEDDSFADLSRSELTQHAEQVVKATWDLSDTIVGKYSDGWDQKDGSALSYPDWWLQAVGYQNGPPPVPGNSVGCSDEQVGQCLKACAQRTKLSHCAASCLSACEEKAQLVV